MAPAGAVPDGRVGDVNAGATVGLADHVARNFVNGSWRFPQHGYEIDVYSPTRIDPLGSIPRSARADVEAALTYARAALRHDLHSVAWQRVASFCANLRRRAPEIARLESMDSGIPLAAANALVAHSAAWVERLLERPAARVRAAPPAVCVRILPAYAPFWLYCSEVAGALLAGNATLLKPSSVTPLTAVCFAEIVEDLDLPPGCFGLLQGTGTDVGAALARHPLVDQVGFVGSRETARTVARGVAEPLTPCSLTTGNLHPSILYPDGDIDRLAAALATPLLRHAGQAGFASRWCLVPEGRIEDVLHALRSVIGNLESDNGYGGDLAPLVGEHKRDKADQFLATFATLEHLDKRSLLGRKFGPPGYPMGYFYSPSILVGASDTDLRRGADIAAPILFLSAYGSEDDLYERLLRFPGFGSLHLFSTRGLAALPPSLRRLQRRLYVNGHCDDAAADSELLWLGINNGQPKPGLRQEVNHE